MLKFYAPRGSTIHLNGKRFLANRRVDLSAIDHVDTLTVVYPNGERRVIIREGENQEDQR